MVRSYMFAIPIIAVSLSAGCSKEIKGLENYFLKPKAYVHTVLKSDDARRAESSLHSWYTYADFDRKDHRSGLNYKEFIEISGLEKRLSDSLDNRPIWVSVFDSLNDERQEYGSAEGHGYVLITLSIQKARKIDTLIFEYQNKIYPDALGEKAIPIPIPDPSDTLGVQPIPIPDPVDSGMKAIPTGANAVMPH